MKTTTFRVVEIDQTSHWVDYIAKYGPIYGLFFYDPNQVTYLCEMTPSHYLYWIEDFSDFDGEVPEDIQDDIFTGATDDQNIYIHCHSVPVHFQEDEFEWEEDDTYDNVAERAMEHYRGNTPYNAKGVGRARSSKR